MTISIVGCGWFGVALAKSLIQDKHSVKGSTTSPEKLESLSAEDIEPFLIRIQKRRTNLQPFVFSM